jgi:hypothetical protein
MVSINRKFTRAEFSTLLLMLFVCTIAVGMAVFAMAAQKPAIMIHFGLFGIVGVMISRTWGKKEARLFTWVFSSAVLAALAIYLIYLQRYGLPYYVGGSDDLRYELEAERVASTLGVFDYSSIRGGVVKQGHNSVGYVYVVSLLIRSGELVGGFHTMLPRLFNCLALGLIAVVTYRIGKSFDLEENTSWWIGLFVGLSPIMVYNSVHTFRDTLISLLTIWVVYIWSTNREHRGIGRRLFLWIQTAIAAVVASELRLPQAVAILAIALVGDLGASQRRVRPFSLEDLYRLAMLAVLLVVALFFLPDSIVSFAQQLGVEQEKYTAYRTGLSDGLAAYVFGAPVPLNYLLRIAYALITPIPVLSLELDRLWLSAGTVIWCFLVPFLVLGFIHAIRDRSKLQLVGAFALLFGATAFISFAERHISQFLPYAALIAGIGLDRYRRNRAAIGITTLWLGLCLALAYLVLKSA